VADRISQIVSSVLDIPLDQLNDDTSPDDVPSWDSMAHINMVMAFEQEFDISLMPEDQEEMLSIKLIRIILKDHGVE
jgi:acyl carrier protein